MSYIRVRVRPGTAEQLIAKSQELSTVSLEEHERQHAAPQGMIT
jgi:hypothetical protein